ncbi:response regulator [Streptomyces sp. NPDC005438]|uniref:response regulator n=1 Tax=Streptomyces sp. NPDC005438 TaxID=3156880 RepID=UPI0033B4194A
MTHDGTALGEERVSILIVDDMEENLVALEAVLSFLGQRLVRARSGEEALKALLREEFAVVLLDVLMPGMDGFETAANIKRLDQTKDIPIILLTGADADPDYTYRGYAIGVADFLTKPFDPWLLRSKINVFLDLHRKKRQLAAQTEQLRQLLVSGPDTGTTAAEEATAEDQLSAVSERLGRVELLLKERDDAPASALAPRITDLEHSVSELRSALAGDRGHGR